MTNPVTPQDYATFLESLRVTEEGPAEMHGWLFDEPLQELIDRYKKESDCETRFYPYRITVFADYLIERLRRAEANAKPPTLLEDVKACMRAGMDAEQKVCDAEWRDIPDYKPVNEFRKLSEEGDK